MHHLQCSNLLLPVHDCFFCCFFFLQTLHIYCSHTSHSVSASYSSSNSHGLNLGEYLSSVWISSSGHESTFSKVKGSPVGPLCPVRWS